MGVGQERQRGGRRAGQRTDERRTVENEMERQRLVSSQVRMKEEAREEEKEAEGGVDAAGKKSNGMDNKGGGILTSTAQRGKQSGVI